MAKKSNKLTSADKVGGVSAEDLRSAVDEIRRQKKLASEYSGLAGKATQNAVERHGLEKTALTFADRLDGMETAKRASVVYASLEYWEKLGFFAQGDAFNDPVELLEAIAKRAHNARGSKPTLPEGDAALNDLLVN